MKETHRACAVRVQRAMKSRCKDAFMGPFVHKTYTEDVTLILSVTGDQILEVSKTPSDKLCIFLSSDLHYVFLTFSFFFTGWSHSCIRFIKVKLLFCAQNKPLTGIL